MKNIEACPLAVLFGYRQGDDIVFIDRRETITINDGYDLVTDILKHCNGLNTLDEIKSLITQEHRESFEEVIELLFNNGVIEDSRNIYRRFHQDSENPALFSYSWAPSDIVEIQERPRHSNPLSADETVNLDKTDSNLLSLIRSRHSVRCFKEGTVSKQLLSGLLESLYFTGGTRSVPSGGGLYPLEIYLVVTGEIDGVERGWYQYDHVNHQLISMETSQSTERIYQLFDCASVLKNALLTVFIAADFSRTTLKYANRGYRFAMIEAGHAAQNANLYCEENGLGAVEWGGFRDVETSLTLGLDYPDQAVILGMVVGIESEVEAQTLSDQYVEPAAELNNLVVGKGKVIRSVSVKEYKSGNYTMPRFAAISEYSNPDPRKKGSRYRGKSFATGLTTAEARLKAVMEGIERHASGVVRVDITCRASEMAEGKFLEPYLVAPFDLEQCDLLGIEPFSAGSEWQWVYGKRLRTGERIAVPVDFVYYPLDTTNWQRKPCYLANSSGVSAHFSQDKAIQNGLLELIERDAIAVTWITHRQVTALPFDLADQGVQDRIRLWQEQGSQIKLLNITIDSVPVVMTIFDSPKYPCVVTGASAAATFPEAIAKSFNEAEFMLLSWKKAHPKRINSWEEVEAVKHHGIYYFYPEHRHEVEWLLDAKVEEIRPIQEVNIHQMFDPIVLDITPAQLSEHLHVVRVMSEKLMPLGFGYGSEHYRHPRLNMLKLNQPIVYPGPPHPFA